MPDAPDEQEPSEATPDDVSGDVPGDGARAAEPAPAVPELAPEELPVFRALDDLPPAPPQVELINDDDLSWIDKPEISEAERERRQERREAHKRKVRRQRRSRRVLKVGGISLAVLLVLGTAWFWWTFGGLERMPASAGQAGLNTPGTNILLVGSNPEEPDADATPGIGWAHTFRAADLVMILHLTRDNRQMYVISVPVDSVLPIPGGGEGRLADAYADGGQDLFVKTIESYSGIRMDRVVALDMRGLRAITDDVGGVIIDVPSEACNLAPGPRKLDGLQALQYVSKYPCLPRKDLDRVERQQSLLRGLMRGSIDGGGLSNPFTVNRLLRETARHLTVEKDFSYLSMFGQLFSMRHLRSSNTTFLTVPTAVNANIRFRGDEAIRLDPDKDVELFDALRSDRIADYLSLNADAQVLR